MAEARAPLRLAIIGCGAVAQQLYARTLPRVAHVRTEFVVDVNPGAATALAGRLGARPVSMDEARDQADAIIVATPPSLHREHVELFLRAGRIIVCEKPFVGSEQDAAELIDAAARSACELFVGHFRRSFPALGLARELVATGVLGPLQRMFVCEGGRFDWQASSGYPTTDRLGGVLFDTGSHCMDMALYATGLDEERFGLRVHEVRRERAEPAHEIDAHFAIQLRQGDIEARLLLSRQQSLANRIRLEYERGILEFPTSLRDALRITGVSGSTILRTGDTRSDPAEFVVEQWNAIFGSRDRRFAGNRFRGLSSILEALARETGA